MRYYTRRNLPTIEHMPMEEIVRYTITEDKFTFVVAAFIDNIITHPIHNLLLLLIIIFGCIKSAMSGDIVGVVVAIGTVVLIKVRLITALLTLYDTYRKGIYHTMDIHGVHTIMRVPNSEEYRRLSTTLWEDVRNISVYEDFMVVNIEKSKRNKADFATSIFWTDDMERVSSQALFLWKRAFDIKPEDRKHLYTENELEELMDYIEERYGEYEIRTLRPSKLHLGIAVVPPAEGREYYTLCTIGAGAYRMPVDHERHLREGKFEHAEYLMILPKDWKMDDESLDDERYWWPFRQLSVTAYYTIECNTWLGEGMTTSLSDNEPYSPVLPYKASILSLPVVGNDDIAEYVTLSSGKSVVVYQIIPISDEELKMKMNEEFDELYTSIYGDGGSYESSIANLIKRLESKE